MRAYYNNLITSTTLLSTSSENTNYPKANIYSVHRSKRFRFTGKTSENIVIDFGTATSVDSFCISSNLTSSATLTVELNATNAWGAPSESESITTSGETVIVQKFTSASYRYARITFADATNTANIEIQKMYLGIEFQMPGIASDYTTLPISTSVKNLSVSGQGYGKKGYFYKAHAFNFGVYNHTMRASLKTFYETVDILTPFFLVINYNDMTTILPEYCTLTGWKDEKNDRGLYFTGSISTEESF